MELYPNLRLLRLQHNYKQEYVADALGMSQPEYSKMESGHRKMDALIARELSKLFDVPLEVILQQTPMRQARPGNAYVRDPHPAFPLEAPGAQQDAYLPREILDKMMYNYTFLLEKYLQQQAEREEVLRQSVHENPGKSDPKRDLGSANPA